jgi:hypothetical protein
METEQNKTELRSGKVRNIIGQIPPFWVRTGTVVIILIPFWIPGEYRKI